MTRITTLLAAAVAALVLAVPAFGSHSGNPPNPNAFANCLENIAKQNAKGVIGTLTGSPNDTKALPTAVTNCDHFWHVF